MYRTHFNLKKKPFQLSSDNSFLWLGDTHARALDLLKRGIDGPQRLLVLTGDIGTGKTTLIHELRHGLPQTTTVAHITDPSIELHYMFRSIAQGLGFDAFYREGEKFEPVLSAFLSRRHQARKKCLIIIDEAHLMPERFLALLPSWAKFAPDNTLTFILAGQLELHQVMEETLGRSWKEQMDVHAMLAPLEEKQTRDYINRRLELAGATHRIFIPGAVREVHRYTKGFPRRINIACDQAMIAAYAKDMQTVDAHTFQEALGILEIPQVPLAVSQPASVSQTPPVAPRFRRPTRALSTLAAAILLVGIAYLFYSRTLSVPPTPSEQIAAKPDKTADMDEFLKEISIMHKADFMTRVPDPPSGLSARNTPAPEMPAPTSAAPSTSRQRDPDPESAHDPASVSTVQPDPDAIIDWLIKEKSR
ncbi:type II secretory pathway protein ExeA [Desulfobacter hydrogenophilus]|uniref:AAA family ATPase n=1 Tax=Desulfobacter hydrogenophilus TaxID=2291 RepID=A0A328F6R2_9BACT|nr:AAA family ATPase [Desulfobacter hydrogenophilus]NDY74372.1 AAA family ATPase [Desulfobacter hydrogenophilus]QBH13411.1 AAA family ATPase [Desulfobacter hydrogenophilus]RAM00059.1 type II secretory pathway protein ExeA [Desulfobacter hydrogenophilus]